MVCPKCGRVLLEGEICPCSMDDVARRSIELMAEEQKKKKEEERIAAEKEEEMNRRKEKISESASNFKNITADVSGNLIQNILDIIKRPKTGSAEFLSENNTVSSIILIVLKAVFLGIFVTAALSSSLYSLLGFMGRGLFSQYVLTFGRKFMIFLLFAIVSLAGSVANAAGFMLISKIQRHSKSYQYCLGLTSLKSVIVVPLYIVSLILTVINGGLGLIGFMVAFIAGISFDSLALDIMNQEEDKKVYYLILIETITIIATFIMMYISSMIVF